MHRTYRPSYGMPTSAIVFMLFAAIIAGVLLGIGAELVSRFVWLIIMFPIAVGLAGGAILARVIKARHVRNPVVAVSSGLLLGLVLYTSYQVMDYLKFRADIKALIAEQDVEVTAEEEDAFIDFILQEETGSVGFVGYLKYAAQSGISIGRIGRGGSETPPLTGVIVWIYWVVELSLIAGAAAYLARSAAQEPYCEQCGRWFGGGVHVGRVDSQRTAEALGELQAGNYDAFLASIQPDTNGGEGVDVYLQRCGQPDLHESLLIVRAHTLNRKGQLEGKDLFSALLHPHMASGFQRLLPSALAPQAS